MKRQITPEYERSKTLRNNFVTNTGDNYIEDDVDALDEVEFKFNKSHDPTITNHLFGLLYKYLESMIWKAPNEDSYFNKNEGEEQDKEKYMDTLKQYQRASDIIKNNNWDIRIVLKPTYMVSNVVHNFSQALSIKSNSEKQQNKSSSTPHDSKIVK